MQISQMKNIFPSESYIEEKVLSEEHEYCTFEDRIFLTDKSCQRELLLASNKARVKSAAQLL